MDRERAAIYVARPSPAARRNNDGDVYDRFKLRFYEVVTALLFAPFQSLTCWRVLGDVKPSRDRHGYVRWRNKRRLGGCLFSNQLVCD